MGEVSPLAPGDPERLGVYALTGRLGEGGQGTVFLGSAPDGEQVAIKLLRAQVGAVGRERERFAREVAVAERVAPFCTARVIDADVQGETPYIVSEYVEGPSLQEVVERDGPLSGARLDRLAISMATALAAIHEAGIVHRDFKPGNVLLASDGPRVIDFGIARVLDKATSLTSRIIGTPAFMSPEQLSGDAVGPASDLFAWASTIMFAATGSSPFGHDTIPAIMNRILHHEPDVDRLSEPLRGIVAAALSKNPAQRPTARQVLDHMVGGGPRPVPGPAVAPGADPAPGAAAAPSVDPAQGASAASGWTAEYGMPTGQQASGASTWPTPPVPGPPGTGVSGPAGFGPTGPASVQAAHVPSQWTQPGGPGRRNSRRWGLWLAIGGAAMALVIAAVVTAVVVTRDGGEPRKQPSSTDPLAKYKTGTLRLATSESAPWAFTDQGDLSGADPAITREILKNLGIAYHRPLINKFDALPAGLAANRFDMALAGITIKPDRCNMIAFSEPVYRMPSAFMVKKGNPKKITRFDDLTKKKPKLKLGVMDQTGYERIATDSGVKRLKKYPTIYAGITALRSGEVDALAGMGIWLRWNAKSASGNVEVTESFSPPTYGTEYVSYAGFAFQKGNDTLRQAVNAEIVKLRKSGRLQQILQPYGFTGPELTIDSEQTTDRLCQGRG